MRTLHKIKYFVPFSLPFAAYIAFTERGLLTFLPIFYVFMAVPLVELFATPDDTNLSEAQDTLIKKDSFYDLLLYFIVPIQFGLLFLFLYSMQQDALQLYEKIGRTGSMGILCGVFGINAAHELGHRTKWHEQLMAKALLLTSLYQHFFIEHNRGHHKHVSTDQDPASARWGENVYGFWWRSVTDGYRSAWHLENTRLSQLKLPVWHYRNEMIWYHVVSVAFLAIVGLVFGFKGLVFFGISASIGILLLETVNYIEHYGLRRTQLANGKYERTMPIHSWNSNHVLGRLLLFELSRHSDHHYLASRKYQNLRHHDAAPQMPTGYPGMILLSLFSPLWFRVMHKKLDTIKIQQATPQV